MDEVDYIELQTLLAKLRVFCMKTIGDENLIAAERERLYKLIRSIDKIRNQTPLIIDNQNKINGGNI